MKNKTSQKNPTATQNAAGTERARPILHQHASEIQPYGKIAKLPIALDQQVCATSVELLNQILADTMTLRDMYKKHHWQVAGHTFYQLHLLFDKHFEEQSRAGGRHRGAHPTSRRHQHRHGATTSRKPPSFLVRRAAAKKRPCKSLACWKLTKSF